MSTDPGHRPRETRLGWLAWALLALAWFATMPARPLFDPDEGRYAEIPREMVVSGDWVTPRFDALKYFEKPPLQYWATAVAYEAAGVEPWTSRLWATALALACLPLVFGFTARWYGRTAGVAALTALAVSPYFVVLGHLNLLDQAFTFWLSGAVLSFVWAQLQPLGSRAERDAMLLAWSAAALAVLSKGIVVGVLAGGALGLYSLIERDTLPWRRLHLRFGVPLFLAIAAPWFVLVSLRNPSFPGFFFVHEHLARFLTTVHSRVEPWWFFLPLLLLAVLPWLAVFVRSVHRGGSPEHQVPLGSDLPSAAVSFHLQRIHPGVLLRLGLQARPLHPAAGAAARHPRRRSDCGSAQARAARRTHRCGPGEHRRSGAHHLLCAPQWLCARGGPWLDGWRVGPSVGGVAPHRTRPRA